MKVNQNISAVISNANLHRTENNLTASIERLSSGYRLNKAKDNPAGMAIANKMRAQIDALSQSTRNASDGTSVLQTADGALNETHAILQRMRELAVQAASDSMTPSDKKACQEEMDALKKEIDRIATDTEFNSKRILDGSLDRRIYPSIGKDLVMSAVTNFQTSDSVTAAQYDFEITQAATKSQLSNVSIVPGVENKVDINGYEVTIPATASATEIYTALRDAGEMAGVTVESSGANQYKMTSVTYGSSTEIHCTVNESSAGFFTKGKDIAVDLFQIGDFKYEGIIAVGQYTEGFSQTATVQTSGNKVTITDLNGFEMIFEVDSEQNEKIKNATNDPVKVELEVTNIGSMTLQVGAHENQTIDVRIPAVDCESLFIDELNVIRKGGADHAISALDDAIGQVSEARSRIGAYQNRLDYAVTSLEGTEENMEAAISRVMDTDMAEEMSYYSNQNVLDQAAISVLTQANDMPQQVLQLLN
ncbi:MAG: flagellin [bacterium]|nr:flagellin [bacterium]